MAAWALKVLPPEQEFYGRLLAKFRTSGNQKGVQQVAACLRAEPRLPDEVLSETTWYQLVYSLAAVGDLPRAHAAFARVRANGAWPMHKRGGMYFVNVLLDAYGADVDGAWRWFDTLRAEGFKGNTVTYSTLVKIAMKAASSAAAMRAHDAMVAAGVTGHAKLYNALVKAHLYEAEIAASAQGVPQGGPGFSGPLLSSTWDPRQVLEVMAAAGFPLRPGSVVVGSLMIAAGKAGQGASVQALWDEVLAGSEGRCPNLDLLHAYMHACNLSGQGERALAAFQQVCPAQLQPGITAFNMAISACAPGEAVQRASLALALQLLRRAKHQGLQPDASTYRALLRLCARAGRSRTAVRLYKDMERRGVEDDRYMCICVMEALAAEGLVDEAASIWRTMVWGPTRRRPNRQTFLKASRIFRQAGALQQALHVYNGMRSMGHPPSNPEFRALMLAATEAAMHDSPAGRRASLAAADLPRGFSAAADAATRSPGAGDPAAVVGPDGCVAPVDLHGLSGAEARAAVLTTLSQLQDVFRKGDRIAGDLVLITGSGQHSTGSPVLRDSVQRLLASLQLSDDTDLNVGEPAAAGGTGSAFAGYARFTGGKSAQHGGASQMPLPGMDSQQQQDQPPPVDTVLVDTGLRPRHGGFTAAADLAAGLGADAPGGAAVQWAQALTEAIILDWCASPRPGQQQIATAARSGGEKGISAGQQLVAGDVDTAWMDSAMQQGAANPGRLVIASAVLLDWLQSKTARG